MHRLSVSRRQALGLTIAVSATAGIAFATYSFGSAAGANDYSRLPDLASVTTTASPTGTEAPATGSTSGTSPSTPLTLDQAAQVAAQVAAPGRVIQWDEDHEPTGLRYDVTLLHDDGTTTDVEVDTVTGQVTSVDHDDDRD